MHRWNNRGCEQERKAMQVVARSGKPAGYSWRLWHDPRPRVASRAPSGPIRDWRYPMAAYRNQTAWNAVDRASYERCIEEWDHGTHPWATSARERDAA